jgi:deoxyribodipyrimidine photo-lyase
MPAKPIIVWFRNDLRLADNSALSAAAASAAPIVAVYIHDPDAAGPWAAGGASRWWLHHSLSALSATLADMGSTLVLRRGPAEKVLATLAAEVGARAVYFSRAYEPWARTQ